MKNNIEVTDFLRSKRTRLIYKRRWKITAKKKKKASKKFIYTKNKQEHIDAFKTIATMTKRSLAKQQQYELRIGSDFSLYENPKDTLKVIGEIAHLEKNKKVKCIDINHTLCKRNELGAEVLLATIAKSVSTIRTSNHNPILIRGEYPTDTKVSRLINSIGVVKEVAADSVEKKPEDKLDIFHRERINEDKISKQAGDMKSRTVQDFVEFIDEKCLSKIGRGFTDNGMSILIDYIGEIIDNAQEHSGTPYWHIYGYFDSTDPENMNVEIVIYNLGYTIAETFNNKKHIPEVYDKINDYVSMHKNRNLSEEVLITVAALQQSYSSKLDTDPSRGRGTVDLINFFFQVANECQQDKSSDDAKMYMISGQSFIKFDRTIAMHKTDTGHTIMPFNAQQSLDYPPDKNYVKTLKGVKFPGTIIGIQFPIGKNSTIIDKSENYDNN